jgi:hypothetical protein
MHPDDAADWTIRNQRPWGAAPWLWLGAWTVVWMGGAFILERMTPVTRHWAYVLAWLGPTLGSLVALLVYLGRLPVRRLKLGDEVQAYPRCRLGPKDIRAIHVGPDPDEDYAEARLPFPLCLVTVEAGRRKLRLVASAGDAARLREWAERKGIAVVDPQGLTVRPVGGEPAANKYRAPE